MILMSLIYIDFNIWLMRVYATQMLFKEDFFSAIWDALACSYIHIHVWYLYPCVIFIFIIPILILKSYISLSHISHEYLMYCLYHICSRPVVVVSAFFFCWTPFWTQRIMFVLVSFSYGIFLFTLDKRCHRISWLATIAIDVPEREWTLVIRDHFFPSGYWWFWMRDKVIHWNDPILQGGREGVFKL